MQPLWELQATQNWKEKRKVSRYYFRSTKHMKSLLCSHVISRSLFQTKRNLEITYYKYHFNLLNAIGDIYLSVFLHIFRSSVSFFLIMLHRYFIVLNLHKQSIRNDFNSFSFNDGILCIFLFTGTCKIERNCTSTLNVSNLADGKVKVEICYTHYGHTRDIQHTWLPKGKGKSLRQKSNRGF